MTIQTLTQLMQGLAVLVVALGGVYLARALRLQHEQLLRLARCVRDMAVLARIDAIRGPSAQAYEHFQSEAEAVLDGEGRRRWVGRETIQ